MITIILLPKNVSSWDMSKEELVNKYYLTEVKDGVDAWQPFVFDNKYYSPCIHRPKENLIMVREFKIINEDEQHYEHEITCPHCGYKETDSWDCAESEDERDCETCGAVYSYEREVSVTYNSDIVKKPSIVELEKLTNQTP